MASRQVTLRATRIESPCAAPAARVRIARATRQLERTVAFYRDGLGFALVDRFEAHAGYAGVILEMPGGRNWNSPSTTARGARHRRMPTTCWCSIYRRPAWSRS